MRWWGAEVREEGWRQRLRGGTVGEVERRNEKEREGRKCGRGVGVGVMMVGLLGLACLACC